MSASVPGTYDAEQSFHGVDAYSPKGNAEISMKLLRQGVGCRKLVTEADQPWPLSDADPHICAFGCTAASIS